MTLAEQIEAMILQGAKSEDLADTEAILKEFMAAYPSLFRGIGLMHARTELLMQKTIPSTWLPFVVPGGKR